MGCSCGLGWYWFHHEAIITRDFPVDSVGTGSITRGPFLQCPLLPLSLSFFNSCLSFIVKSFVTPRFIIFRSARDFRTLSLSSNWRKRTIIGLDLLLTGLPTRCTRWISSLHHLLHFTLLLKMSVTFFFMFV